MSASGPGQAARALLDVVKVLGESRIDYAVIGAMAAAVHGVMRASLDADAVMLVTDQELRELQSKFIALGFTAELRRGDLEDPIPAILLLSDPYANKVDLLAGIRGLEKESFSRCIEVAFEGGPLRFIGLEDFIAMKVFAGGPTDLSDAGHAISVSFEQLDLPLLRRLALRFGKPTLRKCEELLAENIEK